MWLSLCQLRDHHGCWPEELHITVDNTKGENKNRYMIAFCSWLVASGKIKSVRVFFLIVGHTHVIIDHIFGIIASALKGKEILTTDDLLRTINVTCDAHPQWGASKVKTLECLFDICEWTKSMKLSTLERAFDGDVVDKEGEYFGMYDFKFYVTLRIDV